VSHHLKTLKKCGIVKSRDEGKRQCIRFQTINYLN
jgi:DNA-binding transcriptional ArsR family regulator